MTTVEWFLPATCAVLKVGVDLLAWDATADLFYEPFTFVCWFLMLFLDTTADGGRLVFDACSSKIVWQVLHPKDLSSMLASMTPRWRTCACRFSTLLIVQARHL